LKKISTFFIGCDFLCWNPIENPLSLVSKVLGTYVGLDEEVLEANLGIWELALSNASWDIELVNPKNPSFEFHVIIGNGINVLQWVNVTNL